MFAFIKSKRLKLGLRLMNVTNFQGNFLTTPKQKKLLFTDIKICQVIIQKRPYENQEIFRKFFLSNNRVIFHQAWKSNRINYLLINKKDRICEKNNEHKQDFHSFLFWSPNYKLVYSFHPVVFYCECSSPSPHPSSSFTISLFLLLLYNSSLFVNII